MSVKKLKNNISFIITLINHRLLLNFMKKPARKKFRQETVIHSYIVRPLAQEVMLLLWNTNITANQITFFVQF